MYFFQGMEYVYAVYQEKSVSKAAARLCISQPSLSASIKRIENRIGCPLFDRSTKPLSLTECGEQYIRAVERMKSAEDEFSDYVNDWGELKTGSLVIGGSSLFASWVLPSLLGAFSRACPRIRTELVEENTAELTALLQSGRIDLMLDNCRLDPQLFEGEVYREETLFLAVPRRLAGACGAEGCAVTVEDILSGGWRADGVPEVPLRLFEKAPFIMLKPENDTRRRAEAMLQQAGIAPSIVLELDQQLTSYHVASSGLGIAFVSDTLIREVPRRDDLAYFKLPGAERGRNVYFYRKRGRYLTKAMEKFLEISADPPSKDSLRTKKECYNMG